MKTFSKMMITFWLNIQNCYINVVPLYFVFDFHYLIFHCFWSASFVCRKRRRPFIKTLKMTDIQIFKNDRFGEVRVTEIEGKTYFVGIDVAKALGYQKPNDAITRHCRASVKHGVTDNLGRNQETTVITEGDIYRLIAKSQLPSAEEFETWVFDEVLPTIRKHGAYMTPQKTEELLMNPDLIIGLATTLKEERQKRIAAENITQEKTKQLDEAKEWYTIKRFAKENRLNWRDISWQALKAISHEHGYMVKKIFDANYGEVNIYHKNVFGILYAIK